MGEHNVSGAGRSKVLIIDDEAPFADYLSRMIYQHSKNIEVQTISNAFEAGLTIPVFHPHIILLDLVMPGTDGFAMCERIKSDPRTSKIRVIAMTGYATPSNVKRILKLGAEACLTKPIDNNTLFKLLQPAVTRLSVSCSS